MTPPERRGCPIGPGADCGIGHRAGQDQSADAGDRRVGGTADGGHGHVERAHDGHAHAGPHERHDHDHDHDHDHGRALGKKGLKIVLVLTGTFMVAEFVGGLLSNSLALLADAAHMLTDFAAIALSLFALWFAQRPATQEKTYGYLRLEILAALVNGITLGVIALGIFYEAFQRFRSPAEVDSGLMLAVAVLGLLVNIIAARMLHGAAGHSLNVRGAYLHVLGDLLGSVGAVSAAVVIITTGWTTADPLISVFVGLLILVSSWKLVRESVDILLEAVPSHIDVGEVREAIDDIPGVDEIHDLHVWTVTSGFFAMSGHAVVEDLRQHQEILEEIHRRMRDQFGIRHVTVQLEREALYLREEHL